MRIRKCVITGLGLFAVLFAGADIRWLETEYDFGLMKEIAGPKTGYARFVNNGPEDVIVLEAKPSCGCTDSSVPEDPVAPGDTATITFTYDPAGRPGRFRKSVRVKFADNSRQVITIVGNVLGTPESLSQFYPVESGSIRLSDTIVIAKSVEQGKTATSFVNIYNTRADSITLRALTSHKAMSLKLSDTHPGPGDIVALGMYFNSALYPEIGPVEIPVQLEATVGGVKEKPVTLVFRGEVTPAVRSVGAKELQSAPVCVGVPPIVDMGILDSKSLRSHDVNFNVLNDGKSPLLISKVWSDNPAISIVRFPNKLKPGKSGKIELKIDSSKLSELKSGPFRIEVKVASNDPIAPVSVFTIVGDQ